MPSELLRPGDLLLSDQPLEDALSLRPADAAKEAKSDKEHLAAMGYRRYQKSLQNAGAVDFDDLLLLTEELFEKHAAVRTRRGGAVRSPARRRVSGHQRQPVSHHQGPGRRAPQPVRRRRRRPVDLWLARGGGAAHPAVRPDWPDAKVVRLEWNYRSTAAILEIANRLIAFNKERHDKVLRAARAGGEPPRILQYNSETDEARETVADIRRRIEADQLAAAGFRDPVSHQRAAAGVRDGAAEGENPLRDPRQPVVLRPQGSEGHPGVPAGDRFAARRSVAAADHQQSAARHRREDGRDAAQGSGQPRASRSGR